MARYAPRNFTLPADYCHPGDAKREIEPYLFSEQIVIAVDVALATRRPLLVAGAPGCGKSRLAEAMAAVLGWSLLTETMTSRTRLEQLTVEVDHLRRLHDAQRAARPGGGELLPDAAYHNPGVFWWAFDPQSAARRGLGVEDAARHRLADLSFPGNEPAQPGRPKGTVLLIDEIDKAEPDVPNDLLEPLDRLSFCLPDGAALKGDPQRKLLTVITTNRERDLPQAFLRRCVSLIIDEPGKEQLIAIATAHNAKVGVELVEAIADKLIALRKDAANERRRPPGTSEFLDAITACEELAIAVDSDLWRQIERAVLLKPAA